MKNKTESALREQGERAREGRSEVSASAQAKHATLHTDSVGAGLSVNEHLVSTNQVRQPCFGGVATYELLCSKPGGHNTGVDKQDRD